MPVLKSRPLQRVQSVDHSSSVWYVHRYRFLAAISVALTLFFTMLIPHDQRRLHMPEPWSYALAAQNFAQGNWHSLLIV